MSDLVLRPRSATELIDATFQVYRRAPAPFMIAMALVYLPWLAFQLLVLTRITPTPDQAALGRIFQFALIGGVASILLYGLAGGIVSVLTRAAYLDEPIDLAAAFRRAFSRLLPLVVATIIQFILVYIGFIFLIIPGILLIAHFFSVAQVVILEDAGPIAALGRSGSLSQGQKLHILGTFLLVFLLTILLSVGAVLLFTVVPSVVIRTVLTTAVQIVVYPVFPIAATLLYFDARIRKEGFDVEYLAGAAAGTPPAPSPTA